MLAVGITQRASSTPHCRPLELYMGHPTWHQLAALPTDEVYSLLAGGLAEDFVPQGSATKRQRRAPAAQGTAVSGQRAEPGQAQPRAGQVAPPTSMRWVEWPPGSGQYATAVSARVLKHRTISLSGGPAPFSSLPALCLASRRAAPPALLRTR